MDGINGRATIDFRNVGDLVAIEVGSAPGAIVAQRLVESSRDERNLNEVERGALEKQLEHAEQAQIDAMHDEADAIRTAGLIRGAAQIGAGFAGLASASAEYRSTTPGLSSREAAECMRTSKEYTASGQILTGASNAIGATFDAAAKDSAADAASHGQASQHLERRLKEIAERVDDAQTQTQKAVDSAAQLVELEGRVAQATLFIRG